jgi:hypothetical protein
MPKAIFITLLITTYKSMFEQISKRLEVKTQSVDSLIKKQKKKNRLKVQQKIKYRQ